MINLHPYTYKLRINYVIYKFNSMTIYKSNITKAAQNSGYGSGGSFGTG